MKQLFFAFMFLPLMAVAQTGVTPVTAALNTGNVETLGNYFDESMELSILEEEGIYNKGQALQKVKRFLSSNTINSFTEVHQGASRSSDSQYVIGDLATSGGTYRVYLFLANNNGKMIIQELRFDRE